MSAPRWRDALTLDLAAAAAPLAARLLASPAAMHHDVGMQVVEATLRQWGGYMQGVLGCSGRQRSVDLEFDRRHAACAACRAALQCLEPGLEQVGRGALGGGRAAQLLARLREM